MDAGEILITDQNVMTEKISCESTKKIFTQMLFWLKTFNTFVTYIYVMVTECWKCHHVYIHDGKHHGKHHGAYTCDKHSMCKNSEICSELCQISKVDCLGKKANGFQRYVPFYMFDRALNAPLKFYHCICRF